VAETVLNHQESKFEPNTDNQRQNTRSLKIIGVILSLVMIGLTIYVLNLQHQNAKILSRSSDLALSASDRATANYRAYVTKYKVTKIELDETTRKLEIVNHQLDVVSAELDTTKGMLTQTQGMLSQAQDENTKLKQQLQGLETVKSPPAVNSQNISDLQNKIQTLKAKNNEVSSQLSDLKYQLKAFEADFSNTQEGQSLIVLFQSKIKLVKSRMRFLKQEAYFARVAAQKEKDRLAVLNGNSGFVLRDGQVQNPDGTKKTFAIDVKVLQ